MHSRRTSTRAILQEWQGRVDDLREGSKEKGSRLAERERRRGGRDSLPGPILIVPGNEGVIK